jgi:hypothetical protein
MKNRRIYHHENLIQHRPRLKFGWSSTTNRTRTRILALAMPMEVGRLGELQPDRSMQPPTVGERWVVSRPFKYSTAHLAAPPKPPASEPPPSWSRWRTRNPSSPPRRRWGTPAPSPPGCRSSSRATLPTPRQVTARCLGKAPAWERTRRALVFSSNI